uniref:PIH1 domain-containing protein n=1 Tax=Heterorhabditis bacteriophora TaxID=37862 RepID=A0A1I7WE30_HETBA
MRIEQAHGDDVWIVAPTPGYVIKFKEIDISRDIGGAEFRKCFVNVCHCSQLPPPTEDIDEDTLATRLDSGDLGYRIPISIGEIDCVRDNKNDNAVKIDVLVNSVFFESRLAPPSSQFFRHFFCMVMCEAIENKNRLKMGDIEQMRIFKRPPAPVIVEVDENMDMQVYIML